MIRLTPCGIRENQDSFAKALPITNLMQTKNSIKVKNDVFLSTPDVAIDNLKQTHLTPKIALLTSHSVISVVASGYINIIGG